MRDRSGTSDSASATLRGRMRAGSTAHKAEETSAVRMHSPPAPESNDDDDAEHESKAMSLMLRRQEMGDFGTDRGEPVNPRIFNHQAMKLIDMPGEDPRPYMVATSGAVVQHRPELEHYEAFERQFYDSATDAAASVLLRFEDREELIATLGDPWAEHSDGRAIEAPLSDLGQREDRRQVLALEEIDVPRLQQRLRSSDWTGIQHRIAAVPGTVERVGNLVTELDLLVEKCGLTNLEQQRAKALTGALVRLVSSPEPEWQVIVQILNSPVMTALWRVKEIAFLLGTIAMLLLG
jgi:hypothetical protein